MTEEQIKEMARRFLQWKLPDDFHPDGGISFKAAFNEHTAHPVRHEPVGTNLLTFAQAVEMVRHMVAALEAQPAQEPVAHWYTGPTEEQATAALRAKLAEVERERDAEKRVSDALYERLSVVAQEKQGAIAARDEERKLADDLIAIVEGIDGAMNHGTWRDDKGTRLKDTPQWVALYNAARRKEQQG